jgi:PBSX family phage terminase large subunit
MEAKAAFQWSPIFSEKGYKVLSWWLPESPVSHKPIICMEGAVRSGKTLTGSFSFTCWAQSEFDDYEFAFCGKTIGSARRNIIRPLKRMLAARGAAVNDHRSSNENFLEIEWLGHKNVYWIFGGKDERSQDLIQGATLAGIFFDEAILMPISFLQQGIARLSIDGAKIWISLNPEGPDEPFYVDWLDKFDPKDVFYLHFTMDDNPSLSEETKARYQRMYPEGSVWYDRYILGQRTVAEGRIWDFFRPEVGAGYVVDKLPHDFIDWMGSIDYGTKDPFSASLWGLGQSPETNKLTWYIVKEFYYDPKDHRGKQKAPTEYADALVDLAQWNDRAIYPRWFCDPSALDFIVECINSKRPEISRMQGADNSVKDGILRVASLFTSGFLKIYYTNDNTIKYVNNYRWDENAKEEKPLHDGSHKPDDIRYGSAYAMRRMR